MTDAAAIQGDYTDLKFVKGRKVAQIVLEIPIEAAGAFVKAFGTPNPATGIPVALARIQPSALKQQLQQSVEIEREKDKEPRPWNTLKRSQQAGIACSDPGFWAFLRELDPVNFGHVANEQDAATAVRHRCGVNTRSDFDAYGSKGHLWDKLYSDYDLMRRGATV